jgi:hypothetical protein
VAHLFHLPGDIWEMDMDDFYFWVKGVKVIAEFKGAKVE